MMDETQLMAAQAAENRLLRPQTGLKPIVHTDDDSKIHVRARFDTLAEAERWANVVSQFKAREAHERFNHEGVIYVIITEDNAMDVLESFGTEEVLEVVNDE